MFIQTPIFLRLVFFDEMAPPCLLCCYIMLLAKKHPLSFCYLQFHEKITKGYRTLIEGLTEEHELTFCFAFDITHVDVPTKIKLAVRKHVSEWLIL